MDVYGEKDVVLPRISNRNDTDRIDLILLGATGFTGSRCISYLKDFCMSDKYNITWGVAARSKTKLKKILRDVSASIGTNLDHIPLYVFDIDEQNTVYEVVKKAKVVLNCCGPYGVLGEGVIKACVAAGTHYVDVDAEHQFMERTQLMYDQKAIEKGIYIISGCGFDSIPVDMGIIFAQQNFKGTLNSIVTYLEVCENEGLKLEPTINYGTWMSLVHIMANWSEIKEIRKQLFQYKTPIFEPRIKWRSFPHKPKVVSGWAVPFPTVDRSVAHRTQRYFYEHENKRPVQTDVYLVLDNFCLVILYYMSLIFLKIFCLFDYGRNLLLNYPEFFTATLICKKPPSEKKMKRTTFQITIYGEGWTKQLTNRNDHYSVPCDKYVISKVNGSSGYDVTCFALVLSAITVLTENNQMPSKGGVLPPGAAFAKTSLISRLEESGLKFNIITQDAL